MGAPSDEDLVLAVQSGDTDSLGVLVARWEQPLFRFAFRLLQRTEDARDVCQETFLRILTRSERFRVGARFSTWMYQIALNLCRDHVRRRKRWRFLTFEADEGAVEHRVRERVEGPVSADPAASLERDEIRRAIHKALGTLAPEQREVLVLKEFEGLKFREIAEILGCPESTVKSRMYYGLTALKGALARQGVEAP
ncbi:MAG: sigma-70 family RNA polymerase sigma factor [Acidobacteriia bacterium]|nr:sigma-70 family RNA polymerase sigma factor [Terriglobia bacterium]